MVGLQDLPRGRLQSTLMCVGGMHFWAHSFTVFANAGGSLRLSLPAIFRAHALS